MLNSYPPARLSGRPINKSWPVGAPFCLIENLERFVLEAARDFHVSLHIAFLSLFRKVGTKEWLTYIYTGFARGNAESEWKGFGRIGASVLVQA
jgi:hypothetical protein